jgi:hypothetical protein
MNYHHVARTALVSAKSQLGEGDRVWVEGESAGSDPLKERSLLVERPPHCVNTLLRDPKNMAAILRLCVSRWAQLSDLVDAEVPFAQIFGICHCLRCATVDAF